jgi:N-acetylglutamate synthase-like GNAT family acetyltransferase
VDIRAYAAADRDACLEIFDSNSPGLMERDPFVQFLADPGSFFVAEHNDQIVGCGGYSLHGAAARLHWGMVHRKFQRQGLGRFLLFYRLREITRDPAVQMVGLTAPRPAVPFFQSQGFREAVGDEQSAEMVKRLTVCA